METLENFPDRLAAQFSGKTVLLTGGTGFVGKVFVEKMLRCCTDVKKLYLMVRTKKDKDPNERLKEIFKGPLFDLLKKQRGLQVFEKVEAIPADMEAPDLALSPANRTRLSQEVDMIFHCAATIRFDEPLRKAVLLNVRGTKLMLELAKQCQHLLIFVYLSTSYCHLNERILYEKAYPPPSCPHRIIKMCEWFDDKTIDAITKKILGDVPNSYAFSKSLAEDLVNDEMDHIPVIIMRPSVIIPILVEPIPGWTDNINGPMGLLIGAGKGVIRTMYCQSMTYLDYMPVDIVANCLMVSMFIFQNTNKRFYNLTSSALHKLSFQEVIRIGREVIETKIPLNGVLWYPGGQLRTSRFVHNLEFWLFQWIPAIILDVLLVVLGYKPVLKRIQRRVHKGYEVLEYYANHQWDFDNAETMKCLELLNPKERALYKLDDKGIDYSDYFLKCIRAARVYLLKETDDTIPSAKRHMTMMWYLDRFCKLLFFIGLIYLLCKYAIAPLLEG